MNRFEWGDAVRRVQRTVDPNHQSSVNNIMGHTVRTNNDHDPFYQYPVYTFNDPHGSTGVNVGGERLSPPSHNFQEKQSEVEDPDGEPLEMDDEDPELARKRKELREIEEQIMQKKVSLALKKVEPFLKKTTPNFSCNEQSAPCKDETLRDRVNVILQQHPSLSFLSKVHSPKERVKFSSLRKDDLLQEDHPLKLRVKALMKQRCSDPFVLPATTEVISSPAKEENNTDKGFQRFLSILNKGVDMDLLSRIVNDDSEDLPLLPLGEEVLNIHPPGMKNMSNPLFRSESQLLNCGGSLSGPSHISSGERKTHPPSQQRSSNEGLSLPDDDEKKNDRGDRSFGSSSRSKSPPAVKKKKKEEEEKPKMDEQREQLQNILKTLGLDLEVEEMCKVADRTQERLYGKKHAGRHSRREQESQLSASHRHYRSSSSSSSCSSSSSSSKSTSRSTSPSQVHHRRSQSRASECRRSRDRSTDPLKDRGGSQDKEPQKPRDIDKDGKDFQKISVYQHPPDQTHPHPHTASFSSFPDHTLSQYSQSTTFHSENYSTDTDSYWAYTQGAVSAPLYSHTFPNTQNIYHHPGPVTSRHTVYPCHNNLEDISFLANPDLSTSEGQTGSDLRCLQVINMKERVSCLKQLTKSRKKRAKREAYMRNRRLLFERKKEERLRIKQQKRAVNCDQSKQTVEVSQHNEPEQPEDVKRQPTEEEIKANLRKKLEAFNQKVKQKVAQPANSQLLKSVDCQDCL